MLSTQLQDLDRELLADSCRVDLGHALRDDVDLGLRLLEGDAGLEPGLEQEVTLAGRVGAVEHDRPVEVGPELGEPLRHDADERGRDAVEDEGPAEDRRVGAEVPDPHLVGHDEHRRRARPWRRPA